MTTTPKVLLTALVLLTACSGQGSAAPTPSPSAASPAATVTAAVPATPPAGATPAASSPAASPQPPPPPAPTPCPPGQAGQVGDGVIAADLDGDGQEDMLGTDAGAGTIGLTVALSTGGAASVGIGPSAPAEGEPSSPRVLGTADADGDGREEIVVQLDSGVAEPAAVVRLVQLVGCELVVVANQQGETYDFLVGTRTLDAELNPPAYELLGVGCIDADGDGRQDLVGLSSQQIGSQVDWTRTIVTLEGGAATNGAMDRGTYTSPEDDDAIALLDRVTCGQVTFPSSG